MGRSALPVSVPRGSENKDKTLNFEGLDNVWGFSTARPILWSSWSLLLLFIDVVAAAVVVCLAVAVAVAVAVAASLPQLLPLLLFLPSWLQSLSPPMIMQKGPLEHTSRWLAYLY